MSFQYDQYLAQHRSNVKRGYEWLCENLPDVVKDEYRDNRNSKAITVAINQIYAHAFSRVRRLFEYLNQVYALSRTQTVKLSKIT